MNLFAAPILSTNDIVTIFVLIGVSSPLFFIFIYHIAKITLQKARHQPVAKRSVIITGATLVILLLLVTLQAVFL